MLGVDSAAAVQCVAGLLLTLCAPGLDRACNTRRVAPVFAVRPPVHCLLACTHAGCALQPAGGRALARILPHCTLLQDVSIGCTLLGWWVHPSTAQHVRVCNV